MKSLGAALVSLALVFPMTTGAITTADILARSLQKDCLNWKIIGVCLWLHCKRGRCRVRATPRIRHYLPDLVFVAYDHTGASPWREAASLVTAALPWQGGSYPGIDQRESSSLRFKEVDAIGHPQPLVRSAFGVSYLCRSQVKPMFPYFLSALDLPTWRDGGSEVLRQESLVPGLREIGDWPANSWGSVFPRTGFIMQPEDPKAAAVAVQRACDIVTQPGQARVYTPFGYSGHRRVFHGNSASRTRRNCEESGGRWGLDGCTRQAQIAWLPPINETNAHWQMISPITQTQCEQFGNDADWSQGKTSEDGSYVWNLWRQYECCVPGKGRFIGFRSL